MKPTAAIADALMCAYCGERRAVHAEHVVPKSLRKTMGARYHSLPLELRLTVGACYQCNLLKGARKLVPPTWAHHVPQLKELIPGPWRVWAGSTREAAYREVHI